MCKTLHSPYNGGTAQAGNLVKSVDDSCVSRLWIKSGDVDMGYGMMFDVGHFFYFSNPNYKFEFMPVW